VSEVQILSPRPFPLSIPPFFLATGPVDNRRMGRVLVLVVLVIAAVWLLKRALAGGGRAEAVRKPPVEGDLVSCARCGVHLPRAEARPAGERIYCSEEHAKLGPKREPEDG
jgi:uncharacterized protein